MGEIDFPEPPGPVSGPGVNEIDFPQQSPPPATVPPADPVTDTAFQQSTDQPDPTQAASLPQMLQGTTQPTDPSGGVLDNEAGPANSLISDATSDPVVQWATSDKGSLTTMPLPAAGDAPETAENKVFGQSVTGFGDLLKCVASGPVGWAKGLYSYGTKMVNQMGADLGLAIASIANPDPGQSAGSPQ